MPKLKSVKPDDEKIIQTTMTGMNTYVRHIVQGDRRFIRIDFPFNRQSEFIYIDGLQGMWARDIYSAAVDFQRERVMLEEQFRKEMDGKVESKDGK